MLFRHDRGRGLLLAGVTLLAVFGWCAPAQAHAQDDDTPPPKHGRKYKAPPDTSHIEVTVIKGYNKKPIANAAVIFHPVKDGKDEGNLEMKTDPEGKAVIDVIPTGSSVRVQVIADGFATFAEDYQVDQPSRQILITMARPKAQVSTYVDNSGKPSDMKPGVQEPVRPNPKAAAPAGSTASGPGSGPSASTTSGSSSGSGSSSSSGAKPPQP